MNKEEVRDIQHDLRDMVDADGFNADEVIGDLAAEYGVPVSEVEAVWQEMNKL